MRRWPRGDWQRLSAGPGSKGERWYDWQCLVLAEAADADKGYYLLFRRALGPGRRQSLAHRVDL